MSIEQFKAEEQAFPQSQVVPSLANSFPSRKRSPEHDIFADGDHEPLAKKWRGLGSLSPNYAFEFSPSNSPEVSIELSPTDTTQFSQLDFASLCTDLDMSSDPASVASLASAASSAWSLDGETRLIITEQPEGVGIKLMLISE